MTPPMPPRPRPTPFSRLDTPRLILRRFRAGDLKSFVAYRKDPEIARFQSWENYTPEQAIQAAGEKG